MTAWLIYLSIGLPWAGGLVVWFLGDRRPRLQHLAAAGFALAAGMASLALLPLASSEAAVRIPFGAYFGDLTFVPDGLGVFLTAVATIVGSLAVIFSMDYMRGEAQLGRYYALVLLFIGAMAGLALSGSLFFLFIFWEITALCSYALISFYNDDPRAVAGGIKALIITQVGGAGLLAGALAAYSYFGTYDIAVFLEKAHTLPPAVLAAIAFGCLIAAAAKSAQVPFQTWLPDAMEAPTPVSALIHAATMVNAGVYLLVRFFPSFEGVPDWKTSVVVVGALSALLAALMAIVANDLKRVLAYSTISQLGFMVYSIGVGGLFASQFHLLSHAVFKALLFLGAGAVIHTVGTRDMREMGGLGRQMPFVRTVFATGALALVGLPILNGFWSKELILEAGLEGGPPWTYPLMLVGAGLTAYYTFRMVRMVFYGEAQGVKHGHDAPLAMRFSLGLLTFGTWTTWLLAGPFSQLLEKSLPFHEFEVESTWQMVQTVITAPATWLALAAIAVGLAAWWWRERLSWLRRPLSICAHAAEEGFWFDRFNGWIVEIFRNAASALGTLQTGQLNWNLFALVAGLLAILIFVAWGVTGGI